jgi:hypothetical protein
MTPMYPASFILKLAGKIYATQALQDQPDLQEQQVLKVFRDK